MPSLADHHSNSYTKLLLIGDAKSGKTGSLISLVRAGYKLRILDFDNLLDILGSLVQRECPELANNVEYRTLRDKRKTSPDGWTISGIPRAFVDGLKMLDHWKYTDDEGNETDLGKPSEWGPDCVLVLDSLSRIADAAYDWRETLAPRGKTGEYDGRAVYGDAQDAVERMLAGLTSQSFQTNVIVIAHVQYMVTNDGKQKGFPQGIGQKLSPRIPQYFPSVVLYQKDAKDKRSLQTVSTNLIDLANPKPFAMESSYPIETGLAQFFAALQPAPNPEKPRHAVAPPTSAPRTIPSISPRHLTR